MLPSVIAPAVVAGLIILLWIAVVAALFFRREIAAIRLARRLGPVLDSFQCARCGQCCRLLILTDKETVLRIEKVLGRPAREFSQRLPFFGFALKKGPDGACVLRVPAGPDEPGKFLCPVYEVRPLACRRFPIPVFPFGVKGADARCPRLSRPHA